MESSSIEISLVIATYNRVRPLVRLLKTLKRQTLNVSKWEVIVAIDGSKDLTESELQSFKAECPYQLSWFVQENAGPAKARHNGIERAKGHQIAILDDDMEPVNDFLEKHLEQAIKFPELAVVIGRINVAPDWKIKPLHDVVGEYQRSQLHDMYLNGKRQLNADGFATGNVSFPKTLYQKVGGFDFNLRIDEDRELGFRFSEGGAQLLFSNDASAIHHSDVGAVEGWLRRWNAYGHSGLVVWKKHQCDVRLHPLRHFVLGSVVNRTLVSILVPKDYFAARAIGVLQRIGTLFQRIGLLPVAVACFRVILSLQYHRGVVEAVGGWASFKRMAEDYRAALSQ